MRVQALFLILGGLVGFPFGAGDTQILFGAIGGAKVFISETNALTFMPYFFRFAGLDNANVYGMNVGISTFFQIHVKRQPHVVEWSSTTTLTATPGHIHEMWYS